MYSSSPEHVRIYLEWANLAEKDLYNPRYNEDGSLATDRNGNIRYDRNDPKEKPSFSSNLRFFFSYQLGHMYFRYFICDSSSGIVFLFHAKAPSRKVSFRSVISYHGLSANSGSKQEPRTRLDILFV